MKVYASNTFLAGHLLETAFAVLRNEGLQPVDCLSMVYGQLVDGIDISPAQQAELHDYLKRVVDEAETRMNGGDKQ